MFLARNRAINSEFDLLRSLLPVSRKTLYWLFYSHLKHLKKKLHTAGIIEWIRTENTVKNYEMPTHHKWKTTIRLRVPIIPLTRCPYYSPLQINKGIMTLWNLHVSLTNSVFSIEFCFECLPIVLLLKHNDYNSFHSIHEFFQLKVTSCNHP